MKSELIIAPHSLSIYIKNHKGDILNRLYTLKALIYISI